MKNEMGGACSAYGERRFICKVLVWKPEGKTPLGRHWRRREDNIKMNLQEVGCGGMDWIKLAQDSDSWWALVNAVMNLRVP
jgi:D-lyxose ketol-isomerase